MKTIPGVVGASLAGCRPLTIDPKASGQAGPVDVMVARARRRSCSAPAILAADMLSKPARYLSSDVSPLISPQVPAADKDFAVKVKIQQAIFPVRVKSLQAIDYGFSGARAYQVLSGEGKKYFAKIVLSWDDILNPKEMRAEFANAAWAAEQGLGPKIVFSDPEQGTLITEFLDNEMERWDQGNIEPRLSATMATMRRLHGSQASIKNYCYKKDDAIFFWKQEYDKVSAENMARASVKTAEQVARAA